jgi:hypothetical protein
LSSLGKDFTLLSPKQAENGEFHIKDYGHDMEEAIQLLRMVGIIPYSLRKKNKLFLLGAGAASLRDIIYNNVRFVSMPIPYSRLQIVMPQLHDTGHDVFYDVIHSSFIKENPRLSQHNVKLCQTEEISKNGSGSGISLLRMKKMT